MQRSFSPKISEHVYYYFVISLIEVKFTCTEMYRFLLILKVGDLVCSQHSNQNIEMSLSPKEVPSFLPVQPATIIPITILILYSHKLKSPLLEIHINRIIQYGFFFIRPISVNILDSSILLNVPAMELFKIAMQFKFKKHTIA